MKRLALLLLMVGLGGMVTAVLLRPEAPPIRQGMSSPVAAPQTSELREHLGAVALAGTALVEMGERRERNLLVVRQRQAAMTDALSATDAWLAEHPSLEPHPAVTAYRSGAAKIRDAMAQAQAAFLRFDWDAIAAANMTLQEGVDAIHAALTALEDRDSPEATINARTLTHLPVVDDTDGVAA